MGLLGGLSEEPSLFEPFRNTPSLARVRRCLRKQLTWHHELQRRARVAAGKAEEDADADDDAPQLVPFPWLVIISPGRPETVLEVYGCKEVRPGVYEAVSGLHMRVVVLAELPGSARRCCFACSAPAGCWARRWPTSRRCRPTHGNGAS